MKKRILIAVIVFFIVAISFFAFTKITGNVVSEIYSIGPSAEEQACMMNCMKCTSIGVNCTGNQQQCMSQCNMQKPEVTEETSCMESCVLVGCSQYDFSCQTQNQVKCEEQCNMKKEPEAKSEEEQCIRDCVNSHSPGTICRPSQEGEQGNDVCQMCSQQCVHLYAGPCLDEEKLEAKKAECNTCEHCYGSPVMGDSGEGWDCIVDVECKDASSEFGDDPGTGEGVVSTIGDTFSNIGEAISNFFGNLFGSDE
jgi:hypothetical protein